MDIRTIEMLKRNPGEIFSNMGYVREINVLIMDCLDGKGPRPIRRMIELLIGKLIGGFSRYFTPENVYRACCLEALSQNADHGKIFTRAGIFQVMRQYARRSDEAAEEYFRTVIMSLKASPQIMSMDEWDPHVFYARFVQCLMSKGFGEVESGEGSVYPERQDLIALFRRAKASDEALKVLRDVWSLATVVKGQTLIKCELTDGLAQRICDSCDPLWGQSTQGEQDVIQDIIIGRRLGVQLPRLYELADVLWNDILTNARADIRPKGTDWFVVREPNGDDGKRFYFLREGTAFPQITVIREVNLATGSRWYDVQEQLEPDFVELPKSNPLMEGRRTHRMEWLMYNYLAKLIAYHHFTCTVPQAGNGVSGASDRPSASGKVVPIRPFLRRLREGAHPSKEAIERARDTFQRELPSGYTFVRDHEGRRGVSSDRPAIDTLNAVEVTEPDVSVGMEEVLSWIE